MRKSSRYPTVPRTTECLRQIIISRVDRTRRVAQDYLDHASEVIVFGSMAVGLDGQGSDIDVLCIGGPESKVKTDSIDLIVISQETARSPLWLQSELASHVSKYGVWIKGTPKWSEGAQMVGRRPTRSVAEWRLL